MTENEKKELMKNLMGDIGCDLEDKVLVAFLNQAKAKILSRRFPFSKCEHEVEKIYENLQVELAIVLYSQSGAEGQSSHNENGVSRSWRSVDEILNEITPMAGVFDEKPEKK